MTRSKSSHERFVVLRDWRCFEWKQRFSENGQNVGIEGCKPISSHLMAVFMRKF